MYVNFPVTKNGISLHIDNEYIHAATSDNTRRAYRADIEHFESAGGRLPATDKMIERYLLDSANRHNPRTLSRRLIAIRHWHKLKGLSDPTDSPLVTKTMRCVARLRGKPSVSLGIQNR